MKIRTEDEILQNSYIGKNIGFLVEFFLIPPEWRKIGHVYKIYCTELQLGATELCIPRFVQVHMYKPRISGLRTMRVVQTGLSTRILVQSLNKRTLYGIWALHITYIKKNKTNHLIISHFSFSIHPYKLNPFVQYLILV